MLIVLANDDLIEIVSDRARFILGMNAMLPICDQYVIFASRTLWDICSIESVVPLHNPASTFKFLHSITINFELKDI